MMRVVVAGGGTAGHVEPALNLADALRRSDPSVLVSAVGTAEGLESRLVPARGYELDVIPRVPLPRRPSAQLLRVPGRLVGAVRCAGAILDRRTPDVVVGFGSYVALPVALAARRRRIPVVVHEANARAGLGNRVAARFAAAVATSYAGTALPRAELTGIPLRSAIADLDRVALRSAARAELGLAADRPTLLVFGGSQGAKRINDAVLGAARADLDVQVLHATGAGQHDAVRAALEQCGLDGTVAPWVLRDYLDRMDLAYAAADLVLCRAGAMTVAELTAVGLPAVYVPLPHGNGEQRLNAAHVVAAGGGLEIPDADLTSAAVVEEVFALLRDEPRLAAMATSARGVGRPDAGPALAALVRRAAGRGGRA